MREYLTWLLGEEWYTAHRIRPWDAKKIIPERHFWWFKGDLKSQWIQKFYVCDESNPINPRCGKISANFCISPPHPPHPQFYPQKRRKFRDTSWLTKKIATQWIYQTYKVAPVWPHSGWYSIWTILAYISMFVIGITCISTRWVHQHHSLIEISFWLIKLAS